jgi:3-hydroxybutyryl-CoA dehydrogenase
MIRSSDVKNIVIAGAGLMGASMAQIFAKYGYKITLYDIAEAGIEKGKELIRINQATSMEEGDLTEAESERILSNISFSMEMECFRDADYVIEAIVENMDIKKKFWGDVSKIVSREAVLTSNTSGLSITAIAEAVKGPERFAGMHWVNPPHLIPLVEVIAGDKTEDETLAVVKEVAESIHKKPVLVKKDINGFILNRLQYAVLREALYIVENEVASAEDVDNVMKYGLGMRYAGIGPFETVDLGGLDTFFKVGSYLFRELSDRKEVPELLAKAYQNGDYGTKTGRGFYDYSGDKAEKAIEKRDKVFIKLAKCLYSDL